MHVLFALGSGSAHFATMVITLSKQDSWITMILASALNYVFLITPLALAKRYPDSVGHRLFAANIGTMAGLYPAEYGEIYRNRGLSRNAAAVH